MSRPFTCQLLVGWLLLAAACVSLPPVVEPAAESAHEGDRVDVFVTGHAWHTGIVVPAVDMQVRLPALKSRFRHAVYLEFGWGDKGFYQADEVSALLAAKAVLWPTEAVMHVAAVPMDVRRYFPQAEIHRLCLSPGDYAALLSFIAGSFRRTADGGIAPGRGGLYGDSSFYDALGRYTLFNTCNSWTAKALKSAGADIRPAFKISAGSVMAFLRRRPPGADLSCGPGWNETGRANSAKRSDGPGVSRKSP